MRVPENESVVLGDSDALSERDQDRVGDVVSECVVLGVSCDRDFVNELLEVAVRVKVPVNVRLGEYFDRDRVGESEFDPVGEKDMVSEFEKLAVGDEVRVKEGDTEPVGDPVRECVRVLDRS